MKKILFESFYGLLSMALISLFLWGSIYFSLFSYSKIDEYLNITDEYLKIEDGLTKAAEMYFYFGVIWFVSFVGGDVLKDYVIKKKLLFTKKRIVLYYIYGICISVFISWFLSSLLDPIFVFFVMMPVIIYGINKCRDEVTKMSSDDKTKHLEYIKTLPTIGDNL
jgi:hypothetical protein